MSAKRAFVQGVARTLDLFGTEYSQSTKATKRTPPRISRSDSAAIGSDWNAVGSDVRIAMRTSEKICS